MFTERVLVQAVTVSLLSVGSYRICLFHIRPEPDLAGFRNSNPVGTGAGDGFGENMFLDHRIICLMKLNPSTMLPSAIERQYSSVLPMLCPRLPVFDEIWDTAIRFVFFHSGNTY